MEEDRQRIEASEITYHFDFENKKHKTFLVVNILDVATTIYAIENRENLVEGNPFLPKKPELEQLLLQKAIVSYALNYAGIFSNNPEDEWFINQLNILIGLAVVSNLYNINTND